jgi:hypothetical protein
MLLVTCICHTRFCATLRFVYFVDSDVWLKKKKQQQQHHRMGCVSIAKCIH